MKLNIAAMLLDIADRIPAHHSAAAAVLARNLIAVRYSDLEYGREIRLSDASRPVARGWFRARIDAAAHEHGIAIDIRLAVAHRTPGQICLHADTALMRAGLGLDQHCTRGYTAGSY